MKKQKIKSLKEPITSSARCDSHQHKLHRRPLVQAVALALALQVASAQAATITVDSSIDDANGCSLRNAITSANTDTSVGSCAAGSAGTDTIDLSNIAGLTITLNGTQLPTVTSAISIQGEGVTVDGDGQSNLFLVIGVSANLAIDRLTLSGGSANYGGGVFANDYAKVYLTDSTVSGNSANIGGGVFGLNSTVNFANSTVSGNSAIYGGGVAVFESTFVLANSTVSGNSADYGGGVAGRYSTINLANSTVSGNSAYYGGGIYSISSTINLANSTVSGNSAINGGGIYSSFSTVNLTNSIIANDAGGDCSTHQGSFTASGANLVQNSGNCIFSDPALITGDPMLGPLADNGGPTLTHLPLPDSPVIDAGDRNALPGYTQFDQRGMGYRRIGGQELDIGAVEVQPVAQTGSDFEVNATDDGFSDGVCAVAPGHCNLREAVLAANADPDPSTITFANSLLAPMPATITLGGTQLPTLNSAITIQGEGVTVDGGGQSRLFSAYGSEANLAIDRMILSGGSAIAGGGVYANIHATVNLTDSILSGNSAGSGGGVYARSDASVNLTNSTVSGNSAGSGGGVFAGPYSSVNLTNSTISGNSASRGGGVYARHDATVNLSNSTVSGNSADFGGGVETHNGIINLTNSIIANSIGDDCSASIGSFLIASGANLVQNSGNCNFSSPALITSDPKLGPLADNGGPTLTHLPMPGSPVIDIGYNAWVPAGLNFDQRGSGFNRIIGVSVDLGSVEAPRPVLIFSDSFE